MVEAAETVVRAEVPAEAPTIIIVPLKPKLRQIIHKIIHQSSSHTREVPSTLIYLPTPLGHALSIGKKVAKVHIAAILLSANGRMSLLPEIRLHLPEKLASLVK